jgi:hypothetical protein
VTLAKTILLSAIRDASKGVFADSEQLQQHALERKPYAPVSN